MRSRGENLELDVNGGDSNRYYMVSLPLAGIWPGIPVLGQLTFPEAFLSAGENELSLLPEPGAVLAITSVRSRT